MVNSNTAPSKVAIDDLQCAREEKRHGQTSIGKQADSNMQGSTLQGGTET